MKEEVGSKDLRNEKANKAGYILTKEGNSLYKLTKK